MANTLKKVIKMSPYAVDLLKQYLPKVQSDQTRVGTQKANTTPAELEQLEKQAQKAGAIGKMQKQMLLNARKTTADKTIPFTFPNGETKTWDKMSEDEKDFVHGQSLRTKGRFNEDPYNESVFDAYINPLNFLGNLAANAAESNYTAKQTGSNMPYLSAYGFPLALGALGGLAKGKGVEVPIKEAPIVEAEKVSIPGIKRNANSPLINNFFRNDRSKGFEKLRGIIQDYERFQPYEKEIIEELKKIEKTESPFYDLNDEWVNDFWNQFKKDINTEEGKKRISSFLNPKDKDRLIKEHGSLDKFLDKFANNSDLTDMRFVLDPFEKGASYNGIGMNQIRINRNLLSKLKSMGQEGKDILNKILEHETQHHIKYILSPDDAFRLTKKLDRLPLDYSMDNLFLNLNMPEELNKFLRNSKWYYENPEEKLPMLSEIRSDLLRKGYIKNRYDKITPKMIEKLHMQENFPTITKSDLYDLNTMAIKSTEKNRLLNILNPRKENYSFLAGKLNKLLGIGGVSVGAPGLLNVVNKSKGNGN